MVYAAAAYGMQADGWGLLSSKGTNMQLHDRAVRALQVGPFDRISIKGLTDFQPSKPLTVVGKKPDGSTYEFLVNQTFNDNQITWFKAGSALNAMGQGKA